MNELQMLFELLRCSLQGEPLSCAPYLNDETLQKLYQRSKWHDLAHLVGDALEKNGLLPKDSEVKKRFLQERNMAIYRYEQSQYELECLSNELESAEIEFIPLKGAVIRRFYPQAWMRTSCDLDILVKESDLDKAIAVLQEKLSYTCDSIGEYDAQLFSETGAHIELHYRLVDYEAKPSETRVLARIWDEKKDSQSFCKRMPDEYFYCHHISHIAKHLKFGGCGIRAIMDTWILNHTIPFNKATREKLLKEAELLTVANALEKLANVWFSKEKEDELSKALGEYILTGGVYGSFKNKVAAQQSRKKSKFSYLLSRIFLPYGQLKFKYPKLQKYPILYPFYTVKRWFLLFQKDTKERAVQELNQTANGEKDRQNQLANVLKELDI